MTEKLVPSDESLLLKVRQGVDLLPEAYRSLLVPPESIAFKRFPALTRLFGGFRPREFTILCGSTGAGKTTLLSQLSADLITQKIPQLVLSVETGPVDYLKRVMCVLSNLNVNTGKIFSDQVVSSVSAKVNQTIASGEFHLALYENRVPIEELVGLIRLMHAKHGIKVVMVDNLNFFMEVTRSQDTIVEMDRVVHELILLCKQIDVHIVMVCHPRKTENTRILNEFDIKGSATAVQEAHNVLLFNRPDPDSMSDRTDREILLAKCRRFGMNTGVTLRLKQKCEGTIYEEY